MVALGSILYDRQHQAPESYAILSDSKNAIHHVFDDIDPTHRDGKYLWPAIMLARALLSKVRRSKRGIRIQWIPRKQNLAHAIARDEQRRRYKEYWQLPDVLPIFFEEEWVSVFTLVASNQRHDEINWYTD